MQFDTTQQNTPSKTTVRLNKCKYIVLTVFTSHFTALDVSHRSNSSDQQHTMHDCVLFTCCSAASRRGRPPSALIIHAVICMPYILLCLTDSLLHSNSFPILVISPSPAHIYPLARVAWWEMLFKTHNSHRCHSHLQYTRPSSHSWCVMFHNQTELWHRPKYRGAMYLLNYMDIILPNKGLFD